MVQVRRGLRRPRPLPAAEAVAHPMARLATTPRHIPGIHDVPSGGHIPRLRKLLGDPMLPKEHGAWAMLLIPYLLGTASAGWGGWDSWLLLASVLLLFSSSRPLELVLQRPVQPPRIHRAGGDLDPGAAPPIHANELGARRRRAFLRLALYLGLGGISGMLLLLQFQRWGLLPIGGAAGAILAAQLPLRRRRLDRTWPSRLLSIAALSATGPAAYYVSSGVLDHRAFAVWLLSAIYSGASVFYVRLIYRPGARQKQGASAEGRDRARMQMIGYLVAAFLALASAVYLGWLPPRGLLPYLPLAAKVAWTSSRADYRPTLKQLGFMEIGHAALFTLLAVIAIST